MELINNKSKTSNVFLILGIGLLFFSSFLKIMRFPGSVETLLIFMTFSAFTVFIGSLRNVYTHPNQQGKIASLITVFILISFISYLCLNLINHPSKEVMKIFSVSSMLTCFPILSIYFHFYKPKDHTLISLIKRNRATIEKISLYLIAFGIVFNYSSWLIGQINFAGVIFYVFAIVLAVILAYTLIWEVLIEDKSARVKLNLYLLILSSLAFVMMILPVLGDAYISAFTRSYMIFGAVILILSIAITHYNKYSSSENKKALSTISAVLIFYPTLRLGTVANYLQGAMGSMTANSVFNFSLLLILITLLYIYRKEKYFKSIVIIMLAVHMIPNF